jgi:hypothetical protein
MSKYWQTTVGFDVSRRRQRGTRMDGGNLGEERRG